MDLLLPLRRRMRFHLANSRRRTSAHSPWSSGTQAPSALIAKRAGAGFAVGSSSNGAFACAVCAASTLAPACSVSRRTVSSLTCTPSRCSSIRTAQAKGIQLAKWTRCLCYRGARLLNSSSRGKKTLPARGACAVRSVQGHALSPIALQGPLVLPSCLQGYLALGTVGMVLCWCSCPLSTVTVLRLLLEHLCF